MASNNSFKGKTPTNYTNKVPKPAPLVYIEPYRLWFIKILNKFKIIEKDELAYLLEQYLSTVTAAQAELNRDTEKESDEYVIHLEPTKWKDQDHYLVLGLQHLRYKATAEDIKSAHRRKALKHHPDKREGSKVDTESDYYACITRAMDILNDITKRRSFDSVDPTFDDHIPNKIKPKKLEEDPNYFYKTFGPVFERNSRWSMRPNVPYLGDRYSNHVYVENFYDFWYNFQSWREFSYLDEEDKEKGENRDERRWLDKQNKAARQQRKKEEMQRIRSLVDNAYACDPRILKFKEEEKKRKEEEKKAKQEEIRLKLAKEEADQAERQKQKLEEEARREEEEKKKKQDEKRLRDNAKKQAKKALKSVEELCKSHNYFINHPDETVRHIEDLDKLMKSMTIENVNKFKEDLELASDKRKVFLENIGKLNEKIEEEKRQLAPKIQTPVQNGNGVKNSDKWTTDEVKLLVKAVSLFPAGTKDRWEVIAQYLCTHSTQARDAKQVVTKVKQIQEQLTKRRP